MMREFQSFIVIKLFAVFFAFGTCMCALTIVLLLLPGTDLDVLWRLNPEARQGFQSLGKLAIGLMLVVGIACGGAAVGLFCGREWGLRLAVMILTANLIGDVAAAFLRHDLRSLIGLPIGGAMIIYLVWLGRTRKLAAG